MLSPWRQWITPALLTLSLLGFAPLCRANSHDLTVVTENWPPYNYTGAAGTAEGLSTEIVRAVLRQAELNGTIQVYPWARTFFLASHTPNTLIYSIARSKERETHFVWIGELVRRNDWFYRAVGHSSVQPASLAEVKSCCTVCVVNKDIVEDDLQRQGFSAQKNYITTVSSGDCMKMVQSGSVQLLVNSPIDLAWELKAHPEIRTSFEPVLALSPSNQEPLYLAASRGTSPDVVRRLRAAFQTLEQSGQLEQIRRAFAERLRTGQSLPPR